MMAAYPAAETHPLVCRGLGRATQFASSNGAETTTVVMSFYREVTNGLAFS